MTRNHKHSTKQACTRSWCLSALCLSALCLLASCGGGGDSFDDGDLASNVGLALAKYVVVDLQTGSMAAHSELADLATNQSYKTTHMVFRAIDAGSTYYGSKVTDFGHQADEIEGTGSASKFFIATFEVTQSQWLRMSGTQPWTAIDTAALGLSGWTVAGDDKPACALSYNGIIAGLNAFNSGKAFSFTLPSDLQWEAACRAGSTTVYSWSDTTQTAVAGLYAVTRETTGGVNGSESVAAHSPNLRNLYDMHGNVWEMTAEKNIRGGSWYDTLAQARAANKNTILDDVTHSVVGARFILVP